MKKQKLLEKAIKAVNEAHSALAELELVENERLNAVSLGGANESLARAMTDLFDIERAYDHKG